MILSKILLKEFPFDWADLEFLPDSDAFRREIYISSFEDDFLELALLFYTLFGDRKNEILIYQKSWWDFSLEVWDIKTGESNYTLANKSQETKQYLKMLEASEINIGYKGFCTCSDWDFYLANVLPCIISCQAPYSPLYLDIQNEYFFYFHHTGSIGVYFKSENKFIEALLQKAESLYDVRS